jgi:nucleotide-binding universal stress UspA family protein
MSFAIPAHILVAVDGSDEAQAACRFAADLASRYEAALTALHVATPVMRSSLDGPRTAVRTEAAARAHGQRVLEEARAIAGPQVQFTAALAFGDPAEQIRQQAQEMNADLVVVGSRALNAIERLVRASVSSAVVQHASCSVLVVRSPNADRRRESPPRSPSERLTA